MARIKQNEIPKNDFSAEEDTDICGFSTQPIVNGECISSFSFDDDTVTKNIPVTNSAPCFSSNNKEVSTDGILTDNRKTPIANGMTPPIDGEFLDTKRTYILRVSTVRKINELKSIHPHLNTYVSTIVDLAIAHYYNYIINEGETQ